MKEIFMTDIDWNYLKRKQKDIRYYINAQRLAWKFYYWHEWFDITSYMNNIKTPTKAFIIAMILQSMINRPKSLKTACLHMILTHLDHRGGCLYEVGDINIYLVLDTLQKEFDKLDLDIKIEYKSFYKQTIIGFVLGKKYTLEYRRKLMTLWKLEGIL